MKRAMSRLFALSVLVFWSYFCQAQYQIMRWYEGKNAAVSINFEGSSSGQYLEALPLLNKKDVRATFFVTGKNADWKLVEKAVKSGHELGNHTFDDFNLVNLKPEQIDKEIKENYNEIKKRFPTVLCVSFAYPDGGGGAGRTAKEDSIRRIVSRYHISARGDGNAGKYLGPDYYDSYYEYQNEAYDDYYFQTGSFKVTRESSGKEYTDIVDKVIKEYGWFIPLYRDLGEEKSGNASAEQFAAQLDTLTKRSDRLWIAPFGDVVKYHKERRSAKLEEVSDDGETIKLSLSDKLDDNIYNQALTIQFAVPGGQEIKWVKQNGKKINYVVGWRAMQFNAIPDGGLIEIRKGDITID